MKARRAGQRAAWILGALLGAGGLVVQVAAEPGWGRPSRDEDAIANALRAALRAHARGEVQMALAWTSTAGRLLEERAAASSSSRRWPRGNAAQLQELLQVYALWAGGADPGLDAVHADLVWALERIGWANAALDQPHEIGGLRLDYDLIHRVVIRLGDMRVDYDLITGQIRRIGDHDIDYDLIRRVPRRIGAIEFDYDLIHGDVRRVAGVDIH
jgi:hypothetical protein